MYNKYPPEATFVLALAALMITFFLYVTWQSAGMVPALVLAYFLDRGWNFLAPYLGKDLLNPHQE